MSKTVPSFRIALENEICRWKAFRYTLRGDENRQAFDEIMNLFRNNVLAVENACKPTVLEPMVMSVLLGHQIKIRHLERKLDYTRVL
jgi:hypothetical protein